MKLTNNTSLTLTHVDNGLRKAENELILAIEHGATLGISFLNHKTKEMKTFQLDSNEKELLIQYLKGSLRSFTST